MLASGSDECPYSGQPSICRAIARPASAERTATMDHDSLSKVDQFKLLTETGAGTPMGTLLRKFWHPIAVAEQLEKGKAQALRVLGEDLTLYRGMRRRPYLIRAELRY